MDNFDISVLPNPVILYDAEWKLFDMNPAAIKVLGFSDLSELKGKDIFSVFHPSEFGQILKIQEEILKKDYLTGKNLFHLHKNSDVVKFTSQFGKIPAHQSRLGSEIYVETGVVSDTLNDRLNTRDFFPDNFRLLDENIPGLEMFLVDSNLHIHCKLGNETFKQQWTTSTHKEWNLLNYFPAKVLSILRPLLKVAFDRTPVSRELSYQNKHFSLHLIPFLVDDDYLRCVLILQNITETKQVEKKLHHLKEEAETANRAKDDFVAKMSHEIRSPLNAINGFVEQLHHTRLNKKQSKYLDVVDNATQHLLSIIDDILIISKIESNQIEIENVPFHIPGMFDSIDNLLRNLYEKKGLKFYIETEDVLDQNFLGDPTKLKQILINLCSNAIKFTHKGSITLKAELIEEKEGKHAVSFQVTDTGIGIKNSDILKILQPFQQVDNTIHRSFSGCGLGLTISKDLIESMGGQLKIYSAPGKGSSFVFSINLEKTNATAEDPVSADHDNIAKIQLHHLQILFVDDDPVNRMLGGVILKKFKVKADFAQNGKKGLKMFKPGKYDLVFLDINMPDMSGVQVAQKIREKEQAYTRPFEKTKIVAMTASSLRRQIRDYLESGMDSVMIKPYNEKTFYRKIVQLSSKEVNPQYELDLEPLEKNKNQLFDMEQLLQITQGDEDFTYSIMRSFVKNGNFLLEKMEKALEEDDYNNIGEAAHTLVPSMEQLGISGATPLLKTLERNYLKTSNYKKDPDLVRKAMKEVEKGIDAIRNAASNMQKSISNS